MKKMFFITIILALVSNSNAQENSTSIPSATTTSTDIPSTDSTIASAPTPLLNSRKGFILGLGIGGGGMHLGSGRNFDKGAVIGGIRVGGGLTERLLIMGETFTAWTKDNGVHTYISTINFSTQYFFINNFYIRPGVGLSVLSTSRTVGSTTTTTESDTGLSVLNAIGYELRVEKNIGFSPEININYDRVDGVNAINYGGMISVMLYL